MFKIICVTNRNLCKDDFLMRIEKIAQSGVDEVILREKDLNESEYFLLAKQVQKICKEYNTRLCVHSFVNVAKELKIDKISLPFSSLRDVSAEDKKYFKEIFVSCHSTEQLKEAYSFGCSKAIAGHIFKTDCKKDLKPRGVTFLRSIIKNSPVPVFAIGGINKENIRKIVNTGANGCCIMSDFMTCDNAKDFIKKLRDEVKRYA